MAKSPKSIPHRRTRSDHAAETAEDYVEAVADIIEAEQTCRVADLARRFGVSHVTVSKIVARLVSEGLLNTAPYQPIQLTEKGKKLAEVTRKRHEIVFAFLIALGVDEMTATIDSEGIEHHVSKKTLDAMVEFMKQK